MVSAPLASVSLFTLSASPTVCQHLYPLVLQCVLGSVFTPSMFSSFFNLPGYNIFMSFPLSFSSLQTLLYTSSSLSNLWFFFINCYYMHMYYVSVYTYTFLSIIWSACVAIRVRQPFLWDKRIDYSSRNWWLQLILQSQNAICLSFLFNCTL